MTRRTFFKDSGTASYYEEKHERVLIENEKRTHQLVASVDVHEPVEEVKDLYPKNSYI